jgi:hypothetical protein
MLSDIKMFRSFGYEPLFIEKGITDLQNKKRFMRHFNGLLDMAFLSQQGSISIELLDHRHVVQESSYVLPVLEGTGLAIDQSPDLYMYDNLSFVKTAAPSLKSGFYVPQAPDTSDVVCNKLIADTTNIEKSAEFWGRLGFKPILIDESAAHLKFSTPFSDGAYHLFLRKIEQPANHYCLDSCGFNCIAFISTDAEKEANKFSKTGIDATEVNHFKVNGKELKILWLHGPSGEIVEIISLA